MRDIKLSEHFNLYEFCHTNYGELLQENRVFGWDNREKIRQVAQVLCEPIRIKFRLPVLISSGARCPELNRRVKGADDSQHTLCEAADIVVRGLDCMEGSMAVFEWIYKESGIPFGQVIHEQKSGLKIGRRDSIWIHISLGEPYRAKGDCREVLMYKNGIYQFIKKGQA